MKPTHKANTTKKRVQINKN